MKKKFKVGSWKELLEEVKKADGNLLYLLAKGTSKEPVEVSLPSPQLTNIQEGRTVVPISYPQLMRLIEGRTVEFIFHSRLMRLIQETYSELKIKRAIDNGDHAVLTPEELEEKYPNDLYGYCFMPKNSKEKPLTEEGKKAKKTKPAAIHHKVCLVDVQPMRRDTVARERDIPEDTVKKVAKYWKKEDEKKAKKQLGVKGMDDKTGSKTIYKGNQKRVAVLNLTKITDPHELELGVKILWCSLLTAFQPRTDAPVPSLNPDEVEFTLEFKEKV